MGYDTFQYEQSAICLLNIANHSCSRWLEMHARLFTTN